MAEDVPENHVVSEDVGMLTGVTEMIPEVGSELCDLLQSDLVIDGAKNLEKIIDDLVTAEVSSIQADLNEKVARIEVLELEIEVGLCTLTWLLEGMLIN